MDWSCGRASGAGSGVSCRVVARVAAAYYNVSSLVLNHDSGVVGVHNPRVRVGVLQTQPTTSCPVGILH